MKHLKKLYLLPILLLAVSLSFCKTSQEAILKTSEAVAANKFTFEAQTAVPTSMRSFTLTSRYELRVSSDTIKAYLPYFGRAYTAPYPQGRGGIEFTSLDFLYNSKEAKKGNWEIKIKTKDTDPIYELTLSVSKSGHTTLHIQDSERQSISFFGIIE